MEALRTATRLVALSVTINLVVIAVGVITGGGVFVAFFADSIVEGGTDAKMAWGLSSIAGAIVGGLLSLAGTGTSVVVNTLGCCFLLNDRFSGAGRNWNIASLLAFGGAILLLVVVGNLSSENFPQLRRDLRAVALILFLLSHVFFLCTLKRLANKLRIDLNGSLAWASCGLLATGNLLSLLAWYDLLPLTWGIKLLLLAVLFLAWGSCYLTLLLQLGRQETRPLSATYWPDPRV